jgi:hypothetical protein
MYYTISARELYGQQELTHAQNSALTSMDRYEADIFINSFNLGTIMRIIPGLVRGDTIWLEDMGDYRNHGICFWDGTNAVPIIDIPEDDYGIPPFYVGDEFPVNHFSMTYCNFVRIDIDRHRDELIRNLTPFYTSFNGIKIYILTDDPYRSYMDLIKIFIDESEANFSIDIVEGSLTYQHLYLRDNDPVLQLERLGCYNIVSHDSGVITFQFGSEILSYVIDIDDLIYDSSLVGLLNI